METVDLHDVEIFSTGKWQGKGSAEGGDVITEAVLDKWIDTFNKVGSKVKPRLRAGHDSKKSHDMTGLASLGWLTGLKRAGDKLLADFKAVPQKIKALMDKKAIGRFSPGLWSKMEINGESFEDVIDHVAILGADLPANMDLDGFITEMYEQDTEMEGTEQRIYEHKIIEKEVKVMSDEKIKTFEAEYKEATLKITEYEKQISEKDEQIKQYESENTDLKSQIEQAEHSKLATEVDAYLDDRLKGGHISPAQVAEFKAVAMDSAEKTYQKDDKEIKVNGLELVKSLLDNQPVTYELGESPPKDGDGKSRHVEVLPKEYTLRDNDAEDVEVAIQKVMKDSGVTYSEAYDEVALTFKEKR